MHAAWRLYRRRASSLVVRLTERSGGDRAWPYESFRMDRSMTMVYSVKNPSLLKGLEPGDKVTRWNFSLQETVPLAAPGHIRNICT